jgi:cell division septal protein FtsQ
MRTLGRWSVVLGFNAVVLALLVFSGDRVLRHLTTSSELSLQTISMEGVRRCSKEAIHARLNDFVGANLLELDLEAAAERVRQDPWVADCSVKRILPHGILVEVTEREPVALSSLNGDLYVVDGTGRVVAPADADLVGRLPVFTGTDSAPESDWRATHRRGVEALATLQATAGEWSRTVREIDLSRSDRIGVIAASSEPRLWLDPEKVDRNLAEYLVLRGEIGDRVGPMEYVDLRWSDRIAVMPENREPVSADR